MVLQAKQLSLRAITLRAPMNRAMRPVMVTSTVIYHLQQMGCILMEVWELAEWVSAAEEVVHEEISCIGALLDPDIPDDQE